MNEQCSIRSKALVIPSDIACYVARLSICTRIWCYIERPRCFNGYKDTTIWGYSYSMYGRDELYLSSRGDHSYVIPPDPTFSVWYYQDYTKDYFKSSRKSKFLNLLDMSIASMDDRRFDDRMFNDRPGGKLRLYERVEREYCRIYKYWVICQIQIIL